MIDRDHYMHRYSILAGFLFESSKIHHSDELDHRFILGGLSLSGLDSECVDAFCSHDPFEPSDWKLCSVRRATME
jgi:hypothetical protein